MAFFKWKESFSVDVPEMDSQHRKFIDYLNQLYDAVDSGEAETVIRPLLDRFAEYADVHFREEEKLLKKAGYPRLHIQEKQHALFEERVQELREKLSGEFQETARVSLSYLRDWLLNHILDEDRKYGSFFGGSQ